MQITIFFEGLSKYLKVIALEMHQKAVLQSKYSHLFNNRGGWNKRGGEAKIAKSLNVEAGMKVEVGKYL